MTSYLSDDFIKCFRKLPKRIQKVARKNYKLWKKNPNHQSLEFKMVHPGKSVYSIRVGIGWRALCVRRGDNVIWFWIGSHADYDSLLKKL